MVKLNVVYFWILHSIGIKTHFPLKIHIRAALVYNVPVNNVQQ